jgi:hypothetical protein
VCSQIIALEREQRKQAVETLYTGKEASKHDKGHTLMIDEEDLI